MVELAAEDEVVAEDQVVAEKEPMLLLSNI